MSDLLNIFPKYVITSNGEIKNFDVDKAVESLLHETALDQTICIKIVTGAMRRLVNLGLETIRSESIRNAISIELEAQGFKDAQTSYSRALNKTEIRFKLDLNFVKQFEGLNPEWGPLGYVVYKRTYARLLPDKNRTEEFFETLERVVNGVYSIQKRHCVKLGLQFNDDAIQVEAQKMFIKMWQFKFLPPGRGLWMQNTDFVEKHGSVALNNCGFVSTKDIDTKGARIFEWLMDSLMLGVGVGFDTKGAGKITIQHPSTEQFTFVCPDSREGWVACLRYQLNAYFKGDPQPEFDFSLVRPSGTPIRGFGGTSSGPGPLKEMLENQRKILDARIGQKLTSVDIVDMMNYIAKCVVAGNVRRSSEIALGDPDDEEFVNCKQDLAALKDRRWASNNSIDAHIGTDYSKIIKGIKENGEPGIIWMDNARHYSRMCDPRDDKDVELDGVNPCAEIGLESFALCCLVETFPANHASYEEYEDTLHYAYLYAKSVTLLNTHWNETNAIIGKTRRIGVSMTGIIDAFAKHGRRNMLTWCDKGYGFLKAQDKQYSNFFCVPQSIKLTTVKPSGTVSLLAGASPGIHYPHSEYYIRRMRIDENSDLLPLLHEAGYPIEKDTYSENTYDIEFPIHETNFLRSKSDVTIWEQVANAIDVQRFWADNSVSITVTFKPEEACDIQHVLEYCEDKLKGISLLPLDVSVYKQVPYEAITKEEYERRVSEVKDLGILISRQKGSGVKFCDGDNCK